MEIGNDYSKAEGIVCWIPLIYCDGVVTNGEDAKNNVIETQHKLKVMDRCQDLRTIYVNLKGKATA